MYRKRNNPTWCCDQIEEKIKDYLWSVGSNAGAGGCFSQCVRKHGQCHRDVPEHSPSSNRSHKGEDITNNYFED